MGKGYGFATILTSEANIFGLMQSWKLWPDYDFQTGVVLWESDHDYPSHFPHHFTAWCSTHWKLKENVGYPSASHCVF